MADLNHLIVWCADKHRGASHVVEILGLDAPRDFAGQFLVVDMGNGVSLDYANWSDGEITPQHLAFLVSEDEFDAAYGRITATGIDHWAEPSQRQPARSITTTVAGVSTGKTPTVTCSRSSPDPTELRPKPPGADHSLPVEGGLPAPAPLLTRDRSSGRVSSGRKIMNSARA